MSLETETEWGWKPSIFSMVIEEDGTFCVIGLDFKVHPRQDAVSRLTDIKETGKCFVGASSSNFAGCAF